MKQNGNHPVSSISCEFRQGNLHQRKGNCESFPTPCGMPRYVATSRIMGLFPLNFGMEVVFSQLGHKVPSYDLTELWRSAVVKKKKSKN